MYFACTPCSEKESTTLSGRSGAVATVETSWEGFGRGRAEKMRGAWKFPIWSRTGVLRSGGVDHNTIQLAVCTTIGCRHWCGMDTSTETMRGILAAVNMPQTQRDMSDRMVGILADNWIFDAETVRQDLERDDVKKSDCFSGIYLDAPSCMH